MKRIILFLFMVTQIFAQTTRKVTWPSDRYKFAEFQVPLKVIADTLWVADSSSFYPILLVNNINDDSRGGQIQFYKNTTTPADEDTIGSIYMYGMNDNSEKGVYGWIYGQKSDVSDGDEAGSMTFALAMDGYGAAKYLVLDSHYGTTVGRGQIWLNPDNKDVNFRYDTENEDSHVTFDGATGDIAFDSPTLYIDNSHNRVGVGSTSPQAPFYVAGDTVLFSSGTANMPVFILRNTVAGVDNLKLQLKKIRSGQPDNASFANIEGIANDDIDQERVYGDIRFGVNESASGSYSGEINVRVAQDGLMNTMMRLEGFIGSDEGQVEFNVGDRNQNFKIRGENTELLFFADGSHDNIGIGTDTIDSLLTLSDGIHTRGGIEVDGNIETDAIRIVSGAASGYLLESDGSGNATWVAPGTVAGLDSTWVKATADTFVVNYVVLPDADQGASLGTMALPFDTLHVDKIYVDGTRWDNGADSLDGEIIAANTIDDDALDLTDITLVDFTNDAGLVETADSTDHAVNHYASRSALTDSSAAIRGDIGGSAGGWTDDGTAVRLTAVGDSVGIGVADPSEKLEVVGKIETDAIKITTGASNGYYLKSDASGDATWASLGATYLLLTAFGDSLVNYDGDGVGIVDLTNIDVLMDYDGGIETVDDSLNIKLDGTTLALSTSGLKAGTITASELGTGSVGDDEIDYANVTFADFDYETAWRVWYSNTDGDVTELALGADGTYLRSNGAAVAPTFDTPAGAGDITGVTAGRGIDGGGASGTVTVKLDTAADMTLTGNWINTANPWADNEVADNITATNYLLLTAFGDSLVNYDGFGVSITDNADIEVDTSEIATPYDVSLKVNKADSTDHSIDHYASRSALTDSAAALRGDIVGGGGWTDDGTVVRLTTSTDSVGIGTANPSEALEVNGNILQTTGDYLATDEVRAIDGDGLKLYNDGGNGIFVEDGGNVGIGVIDPDELLELYKVGTQLKLSGGAADYATFAVAADGALTITTVDTDAALGHISLMPDGYVGISKADPVVALDVVGVVRTLSTSEQLRLQYDAINYASFTVVDDGALTITTVDVDAAEGDIILVPDGYVGIGMATPSASLHVRKPSDHTALTIDGGTASKTATLEFRESNVVKWDISSRNGADSDKLYIRNDGSTTVMSFNNSNQVGIGTESPYAPFYVLSTTNPQITVVHTAGADSMTFYVDGNGDATFKASGGDFSFDDDNITTTADVTGDTAFFDVYTNDSDFVLGRSGDDMDLNVDSTNVAGNVIMADDKSIGESTVGARIVFDATGDDIELMGANVGIGDADPDYKLEILSTSTQLALTHTDATDYVTHNVDGNGLYTITSVDGGGAEGHINLVPDGYVGINSSTPVATVPSGFLDNTSSSALEIKSKSTSNDAGLFLRRSDNAEGLDLWVDGSGHYVYFDSRRDGTGRVINFRTRTAGTPVDAMTIEGEGNIGIMTTNPVRELHVNGTMRLDTKSTPGTPAAGDIYQDGSNIFYYNGSSWDDLTASGAGYWTQTESDLYYNSGNVGIGSASPDAALHIVNTTAPQVAIVHTAKVDSMTIGVDANGRATFTTVDGGGAAGHIALMPDGNVGIANNLPDYTLDVSGTVGIDSYIYHNGDADTYWWFDVDKIQMLVGNEAMITITESTQDLIELGDDGDIDIKLSGGADGALTVLGSSGFVGIGTTAPARHLHVDGHMRITQQTVPGTPILGDIYNDGGDIFFYNGSSWDDMTSATVGSIAGAANVTINADSDDNGTGDIQFQLGGTNIAYISNGFDCMFHTDDVSGSVSDVEIYSTSGAGAAGSGRRVSYRALNSSSATKTYAYVDYRTVTPTATYEAGEIAFSTLSVGSARTPLRVKSAFVGVGDTTTAETDRHLYFANDGDISGVDFYWDESETSMHLDNRLTITETGVSDVYGLRVDDAGLAYHGVLGGLSTDYGLWLGYDTGASTNVIASFVYNGGNPRMNLGASSADESIHMHTSGIARTKYTNDNTGQTGTDGTTTGIEADGSYRIINFEVLPVEIWTQATLHTYFHCNGQLGIGTNTFNADCDGPLIALKNATTIPSAPTADQVYIYAKDVSSSSELHAMDEGGNETKLSPHNMETGEWEFYSKNKVTGRVVKVEMEKFFKYFDEKFGTDFFQEWTEKVKNE